MQGMPGMDEEESENLAALGMHIAGDDKKDEDEDEEDDDLDEEKEDKDKEKEKDEDEEEEEAEVNELEELARLEKELKEEEAPSMGDDVEE
jgi:flagellar biosynthesis component FlhA